MYFQGGVKRANNKSNVMDNANGPHSPPRGEDLVSTLCWWWKLCFAIGLPLEQLSYGYAVHLFTICVLVCNVAVGLTVLVGNQNGFLDSISGSSIYKLSGFLESYHIFLITAIFHAVLVWKLADLRLILQSLNQQITVDLKLRNLLKRLLVAMLLCVATTHFGAVASVALISPKLLTLSTTWATFFWVCRRATFIYSMVIGYTLAMLIIALGYQFSLLKEEIATKDLISWKLLYNRHVQLCKLTGELQDSFALLLTLMFVRFLIGLCITGFYMAEEIITGRYSTLFPVMSITTFEESVRCISLCAAADYLSAQASSLALQLAQVELDYLETINVKEIVRRFSINVRNLEYLTSFSVGGLCRLGKPLLLTMLGVLMTYFVILGQMNDAERGIASNCTQKYEA